MDYQCEVKEQPAQLTVSIRTRAAVQDLPQVIGGAYGTIVQYLGEVGEQPSGPPFVVYYNMDMQDLDMEIGFPLSKRLAGKGEVKSSGIPGGKVATCLYVGPYDGIGSAYEALHQWIKDSGYEAAGWMYEMYLNDPDQTPPEELQTQIVVPLKSA